MEEIKRYLLFIFCFLCGEFLSAQNHYEWSLSLDTVKVSAKKIYKGKSANIASKVNYIDSEVLQSYQNRSLSELLSDNSMIYIKSLGQGALSTSSFRGTSSSHTQVTWNGIELNPTMSNSFDFSQVPAFFTDEVNLYYGNTNLNGGTGALGGTVDLVTDVARNDSLNYRLLFEYGQNNTYNYGLSAKYEFGRWITRVRGIYRKSDNNFKYLNILLSKDPFYERRKESEYNQWGVMHEAYYSTENSRFTSNVWLQQSDKNLPQPIIVYSTYHEKQKDNDFKWYLGYDYKRSYHTLNLKAAYMYNSLDWDKWYDSNFEGNHSRNSSYSANLKANYSYAPSSNFKIGTMLSARYDNVHSNNYIKTNADRYIYNLQTNIQLNLSEKLSFNFIAMGEYNDDRLAPTGNIGVVGRVIPDILTLKGTVGYNYRFPSMNDLYWQPGGDTSLKPEKGFSYDATASLSLPLSESFFLNAELSAYMMNIDDWIMWLPTDNWFWKPRNVMNVLSWGIESSLGVKYRFNKWNVALRTNYTYTPSYNRERNFNEDNTYNKQLPYIPKHKANIRLNIAYSKVFMAYSLNYTGLRYTSADESYSTNAYTVNNVELGANISLLRRYKITPKLVVENLFNAYYESTQYYPMPLRNFLFSVAISF